MTTETLTDKQQLVLSVLPPPEGMALSAEGVALRTGIEPGSVQTVLYHLHDAGLVGFDAWGYYRKESK